MELATVEMNVPKKMIGFWTETDIDLRNAMLIYPAIWNGDIAYGKAAEIIGMDKLELMDMYEQLGLPCIDLTREDVMSDIETLAALRN